MGEEFRRRVDEKRSRMHGDEKDDFLFKLRQLRPDAVTYTSDSDGEKDFEAMKRKKRRMEREQGHVEELEKEMKKRQAEEREKVSNARRKEGKEYNEAIFGKERLDALRDKEINEKVKQYQFEEDRQDVIYEGLNKKNPANAGS